jgi:hypothetical protein
MNIGAAKKALKTPIKDEGLVKSVKMTFHERFTF